MTCVSLTVFLIAGEPGGGQPMPASHHWFTAGAGVLRRCGGRVAVMCAAVVFLTQTTPATMKADVQ